MCHLLASCMQHSWESFLGFQGQTSRSEPTSAPAALEIFLTAHHVSGWDFHHSGHLLAVPSVCSACLEKNAELVCSGTGTMLHEEKFQYQSNFIAFIICNLSAWLKTAQVCLNGTKFPGSMSGSTCWRITEIIIDVDFFEQHSLSCNTWENNQPRGQVARAYLFPSVWKVKYFLICDYTV